VGGASCTNWGLEERIYVNGGRTDGKRAPGRPKRRRADSIKMDRMEKCGMDWSG
jgi:hypothetical protein